jgi:hypothetical protein
MISTKGNSGEFSISNRPPRIETAQRRLNMTPANFEIKCDTVMSWVEGQGIGLPPSHTQTDMYNKSKQPPIGI